MGAMLPSGLLSALLQDAVEIDWSNPITRGLVFAAIPGKPELISGVQPVKIGGAGLGSNANGRAFTSSSNTADGWYWPIPATHPLYSITTQDTLFVLANRTSTADYGALFGVAYRSGAWANPFYAYCLATQAGTANTTGNYAAAYSGTARVSVVSPDLFFQTGVLQAYGATRSTAGRIKFYRGPAQFGGDLNTQTATVDWSGKQYPVLFNRSTAVGEGVSGTANIALLWNRELSPEEWRSISDNPGQVVRPVRRSLFTLQRSAVVAPPADTSLTGGAAAVASAYGALLTAIPLSSSVSAGVAATGALSTSVRLAGSASAQGLASGTATTSVRLAGAATSAQTVATGALSTAIPLAGTGAALAQAAGALSTSVALSGSALARSSASGALAGGAAALTGAAAAQASVTGALSTAIVLSGGGASRVSATGVLAGRAAALSGPAVARAAAGGVLSTSIALSGTAVVQSAVAGNFAALGAGVIDVSKISSARIVVFEGSGSRVTPFESSGSRVTPFDSSGSRVTPFEGSGSKTVRFE